MGGKRYAVLVAGHSCEYVRDNFGGAGPLYVDFLREAGDTWDCFMVIDGQFPPPEDLHKYNGFVITGSRQDAHGDAPWVLQLCRLIARIHEKRIKLLGICFGHQVVCRALGGKTGRSPVGWEIGLKKIVFSDVLLSKPYAAGLPPQILIYEVHQDQVYEIPPGAELLASSEKTPIEMFAMGNNVLAIQGHPEFTEDVLLNLLESCYNESILQEDVLEEAKISIRGGKPDRELVRGICKSFLRGTADYSSSPSLQVCHSCHMVHCLQTKSFAQISSP